MNDTLQQWIDDIDFYGTLALASANGELVERMAALSKFLTDHQDALADLMLDGHGGEGGKIGASEKLFDTFYLNKDSDLHVSHADAHDIWMDGYHARDAEVAAARAQAFKEAADKASDIGYTTTHRISDDAIHDIYTGILALAVSPSPEGK